MKKVTMCIFLVVFMLAGLYAKGEASYQERSPLSTTAKINVDSVPNRDTWDVLYTFNAPEGAHTSVATDGVNIYTSAWNGGNFARYDMDGNYLATFTIPGADHLNDMTYDGTYFYGGIESAPTFFVMDLANETLINTVTINCTGIGGARHISYDPELDGGNGGLWVGDWSELGAVTMDGSEIFGDLAVMTDCPGTAYDPWTPGGPYLWIRTRTGDNESDMFQFHIDTQTFTGVYHETVDLPGYESGTAAGCSSYRADDGTFVLLVAINMSSPNLIGAYELAPTLPLDAPYRPTDLVVTPADAGALEAELSWVCPTITVGGVPLTELTEMQVLRDSVLIYTDDNPTIGGTGSFNDITVPEAGMYEYSVLGLNSNGIGVANISSVWIGEDVPSAVDNLLLEKINDEAYLTWVNPTTGLHGGAYNNPLFGYHIYRYADDAEDLFEIAGSTTEYTDTTVPEGNVYYTVQPYNISGNGGIAESNIVLFGEGGEINIFIQCDSYGSETTWEIVSGETVVQSGGPYGGSEIVDVSYMLPLGDYTFTIYDSYGDGINSGYGEGYYILSLDGEEIFYGDGTFTSEESTDFSIVAAVPGTIEGTVTLDGGDGDMEDVLVTAGSVAVTPAANGDYVISISPGSYNIVATLNNYVDALIEGVVVTEGGANTGNDLSLVYSGSDSDNNIIDVPTALNSNYPNPFNPTTNIAYSVSTPGHVCIDIYNVKGKKVKTLVNETLAANEYNVIWNGDDDDGHSVASGIYFYKMKASKFNKTKKMILLK